MTTRDIGTICKPPQSSSRPTHNDEQAAFDLLEHIEESLIDLRHMLEESVPVESSEAAVEISRLDIDAHSNHPQQPLRIVLLKADESTKLPHCSLPLKTALPGSSVTELHAALKQREEYIAYLCGQIREMTIRIEAWLRLLQERALTDETAIILKDAQECVTQLVKTMEIELAIERAELGRERAQLEAERRDMKFAKERTPQGASEGSDAKSETPLMQRWRRFLTAPPMPRPSPTRLGTSGTDP